jgi:hypothetical protein
MSASVSRSIVDVVERAIPGTDVKLVPSRRSKPSSTGSLVSGNYGKDGKHLAGVSLTAYANAGTDVGGNPCTLRPGQVAGHQGAPAPDDVCTSVARPDGTTVWFWRMGHSASRPWTTADTEEVQVIYRRADGVAVNLSISNLLADSRYQTPKFVIPDDQMLAVVTAPEVTQLL